MILTERERLALHDIETYPSGYCWKQASMRKLQERGFTELIAPGSAVRGKAVYWRLTDAGRVWLAANLRRAI